MYPENESHNGRRTLNQAIRQTRQQWVVGIQMNYKTKRIGYYNEFDQAVSARKDAEIRLGFHQNHGADKPRYPD